MRFLGCIFRYVSFLSFSFCFEVPHLSSSYVSISSDDNDLLALPSFSILECSSGEFSEFEVDLMATNTSSAV